MYWTGILSLHAHRRASDAEAAGVFFSFTAADRLSLFFSGTYLDTPSSHCAKPHDRIMPHYRMNGTRSKTAAIQRRGKLCGTSRISFATSSRTPIYRAYTTGRLVEEMNENIRSPENQRTVPEQESPFPRHREKGNRHRKSAAGDKREATNVQRAHSMERIEYDQAYLAAKRKFSTSGPAIFVRSPPPIPEASEKSKIEVHLKQYTESRSMLKSLLILKAKTVIPTVFAPWGEVGLMLRLGRILSFTRFLLVYSFGRGLCAWQIFCLQMLKRAK